jgi:hypothetical protein
MRFEYSSTLELSERSLRPNDILCHCPMSNTSELPRNLDTSRMWAMCCGRNHINRAHVSQSLFERPIAFHRSDAVVLE